MRGKGLWLSGLLLLAGSAWALDPDIVVVGMMSDRAILKVDGQALVLHPGETQSGIELVSVSSTRAVLRVNGQLREFGLGMDTSGGSPRHDHHVDIFSNAAGDYVTDGIINGQGVRLLVDDKSNSVLLSSAEADVLSLSYRSNPTGWEQRASGQTKVWLISLDSVKVGEVVVHNIAAAVYEGSDKGQVVLGHSFLDQVTVTRERSQIRLTTREN